jgi:hypothetical protein
MTTSEDSLDLAAIQARADAATSGPWHWAGNVDSRHIYLANWVPGMGRCTVMDFSRWGMQEARPRFADDNFMMKNADTMPVFEVSPRSTRRDDPAVYRADLIGIRHPDAEFIAAARTDVPALVARVRADESKLALAEKTIQAVRSDFLVGYVPQALRDLFSDYDVAKGAL